MRKITVACLLLLFLESMFAVAAPADPGLPYLSGGIGDEELAQIQAQAKDFNLKVTFAEKSGAYLADVGVTVVDTHGHKLLTVQSAGPLLLIRLPAGIYRIEASSGGQTRQAKVHIRPKGRTDLTLRW